jgi:multiple sugar transport system ATP-binding protein
VARQVGQPAINAIECIIKRENNSLFLQSKKTPKLRFKLLANQADILKAYGREEVILGVRPQDIGIVPLEGGECVSAKVDVFQPLGSEGVLTALVDGSSIVSLIDPEAQIEHEQNIDLFFETRFFYLFDSESKSMLVS